MRRWVAGLTGGIAAGVTLFLVGAAFHVMIPVIASHIPPQFADSPLLYRPWSGWTGTYMLLHPVVYGFVFAAAFLGLRHWSNFPPGVRGGLIYGTGVFVVGSLPVYLLAFASFQMSPEVAISWIAQSLAQYAIAGMALVRQLAPRGKTAGLHAPPEVSAPLFTYKPYARTHKL